LIALTAERTVRVAMDATYLTELRTLNEGNFARFDAKLEQRMAEMRAELRTALAELRTHADVEFANVRGAMDAGFERLRREIDQANTVALRWFIGLTVTTLVTVAATLIAAALR
jgi:hypothetical protein